MTSKTLETPDGLVPETEKCEGLAEKFKHKKVLCAVMHMPRNDCSEVMNLNNGP
jgi:hypothetical protein